MHILLLVQLHTIVSTSNVLEEEVITLILRTNDRVHPSVSFNEIAIAVRHNNAKQNFMRQESDDCVFKRFD